MEIIFEILAQVAGAIVQIVAELVLQVIFEALVELGMHAFVKPRRRRRPPSPYLAAVGYLTLGILIGEVSLVVFPSLFIHSLWLRILNLVLTPILAGFVMAGLGSWRLRRDQMLIRMDRFGYGFLFALAMALTRFFFAI